MRSVGRTESVLETIRKAWSWCGLSPAEVVDANAFGNVIVRATDGSYWRICPEELTCERIAEDRGGYERVIANPEFQIDWKMDRLVALAAATLGSLSPERCYCLKMPATFGGAFDVENIGTITREEVLSFSGNVAQQIKDLPDGARVTLKVINPKPS